MQGLWIVLHAGDKNQKTIVRTALEALSSDPDNIIASEAAWYLKQPWDASAPLDRLRG